MIGKTILKVFGAYRYVYNHCGILLMIFIGRKFLEGVQQEDYSGVSINTKMCGQYPPFKF